MKKINIIFLKLVIILSIFCLTCGCIDDPFNPGGCSFEQQLEIDAENLVVFPSCALEKLNDASPEVVFASVYDDVEIVFEDITWKSWMPDRPVNSLEHILPDITYWVYVNQECSLIL